MSKEEKVLVQILVKLNQDQQTVIGIMLMLDGKKDGVRLMIDYLRTIDPTKITTQEILEKVMKIREN